MRICLSALFLSALATLTGATRTLPTAPFSAPAQLELTRSGTCFVIGGTDRFLLGASLFDALSKTPPADADLDALQRWGVAIVRVWAHWRDPIYGSDGALLPDGRQRLERLVERLASRNLLLELVLLRPGQLRGQRFGLFSSAAARTRAVREITELLRPHRHVLFDLYNEHDHPDGSISHREARVLRDTVKAADSARLVTISSTAHHFVNDSGELGDSGRTNLFEEAGSHDGEVAVDVMAVHFPRTADWAEATELRVNRIRQALASRGYELPVYLNEPNRARYGGVLSIAASQYLRAAQAARRRGAAGWVFHTDAGYDSRRSFLSSLSREERQAIDRLAAALIQ